MKESQRIRKLISNAKNPGGNARNSGIFSNSGAGQKHDSNSAKHKALASKVEDPKTRVLGRKSAGKSASAIKKMMKP